MLVAALVLTGCATPSPSYSDYQTKVATTATAMISIVNTARLGAQTWERAQVMGAYADLLFWTRAGQ